MVAPQPAKPDLPILELGPEFYDPVEPAEFPGCTPRFINRRWAERVGLGALSEEGWSRRFCRFEPLPGNLPQPLALRYHGHQFRVYNPEIGDGRGFLFAQVRDDEGRLLDLGTKGSGQTPYSRRHCESTGNRGRTVTLKVKFFDFEIITRSRSVPTVVSSRDHLESLAIALLQAEISFPKSVRLLGVSLSSLQTLGHDDVEPQLDLPI